MIRRDKKGNYDIQISSVCLRVYLKKMKGPFTEEISRPESNFSDGSEFSDPDPRIQITVKFVLILDSNLEIDAPVRSNLYYFRHLIRSKAVTNRIFFLR